MEFYTQNNMSRPIRLSESTRQFAYDSLNHKYGLDTKKTDSIVFDDLENYYQMSKIDIYDAIITRIASDAPIRICENERLSGAATLGMAIRHFVPATRNGEPMVFGVSHLTLDFDTVVKYGLDHIRAKVNEYYEKYRGSEKERFMQSCVTCLDAFDVWHKRYLDALAGMPGYEANYKNLLNVPHKPASNFYEAVQSIWFMFAFQRVCGTWPGIGRIDQILGGYLKKDLADGTLTLDEAREILAHLFIKGCEWVAGGDYGSGDAQHYQNIVLAGIDEDGNEVTNEVTYLVLDILEELGISDFPTSVRLNKNTDEKLLRRVAEVMRFGGGILAVYNEEVVIDAFVKEGYDLREARKFANDGCWEVQIPGKTYFSYTPFDSLKILQTETLHGYEEGCDYPDYESLFEQYIVDLAKEVDSIYNMNCGWIFEDGYADGNWKCKKLGASTVPSLFEGGCIEKGISYNECGPVYMRISPHIGGLADVTNSLYAIKKLVYEEKKLTLPEFLKILKNNWEGEEVLRRYVQNKYSYYGNDNDEVDSIAVEILKRFAEICKSYGEKSPFEFIPGISTFGRQLEWSPHRLAVPHGRFAHEILAANCSPTPGSDKDGASAIVKSYCKPDHTEISCGSALDIKLLPSNVEGENGLNTLVALMRGFVTLGGFFMQPDVADAAILREAQKHPEDYQTLSVRVSGWNARFVTLNKDWQQMIIEQNEK
ncbi:MAG: hypothetical protein E7672_05200 [Ruminococcaceae bacterium]|nr:hypothetical protein [Oscillospiraceae bacterium]